MLTIAHKMTYNSEGTEVLLAWRLKKWQSVAEVDAHG